MEMRWPALLVVGLLLTLAVSLLAWRESGRRRDYAGGTRAANTGFAKSLPEYRARKRLMLIASYAVDGCLVAALASASFAMGRPSATTVETTSKSQHDVMLCIDVSYSLYEQNERLIASFKDLAKDLRGDRVGIMLFNCSSYLYVPMTDDYDYLDQRLDELHDYLMMQRIVIRESGYEKNVPPITSGPYASRYAELEGNPSLHVDDMNAIEGQVLRQNYRGSSIIGEGLASALYAFPHLKDQERDRVIILSTDNDDSALVKPDVTFREACALCKENKVHLYGVYPSRDAMMMHFNKDKKEWEYGEQPGYDERMSLFKSDIDDNGGTTYVTGDGTMDTSRIIDSISKNEAIAVDAKEVMLRHDEPLIPYSLMLMAILVALTIPAVVRL